MAKELLILRHGKSSWEIACDEFHRPLKKHGKQGAKQIGLWVQQQQLVPDLILSSPAVRAIETAKRCAKAMGLSEKKIQTEPRIYEAHFTTLMALLQACPPQIQRVMLVGHNPSLEDLLRHLVHYSLPDTAKLLPTAAMAHLTLQAQWSQTRLGGATLHQLILPSSLG